MRKLYKILTLAVLAFGLSAGAAQTNPFGKFTVVIDAGHGGNDVGASENGVHEKDINLGVAQKLKALIAKNLKEDINVVMTRDDDKFVSLQERANIANRNHGNLFISIHTNSVDKSNTKRKSVQGASVYALGLHKDQSNLQVAQRENAVIELENNYEQKYSGFDPNKDESYIIFEMAQKKTLGQSLKFAAEAQKQLVHTAGRADRGVKQAGFWVLWATSMPAVLVELDFICNPDMASYLGSEEGQQQLALALYNAFVSYATSAQAISAPKSQPTASAAKAKDGKKNSKKTDNRSEVKNTPTPESDVNGGEATPVLVASTRSERTNVAPERPAARRNLASTPGNRKRRSASARRTSESRVVESDNIVVLHEDNYLAKTQIKHAEIASADSKSDTSPDKNSKKDKKKKDNQKSQTSKSKKSENSSSTRGNVKKITVTSNGTTTEEYNGKTKTITVNTDPKQHKSVSNQHPKVNRIRTVYMIQILASADELKPNNPRFGGLKPISSFRENGLYKYTYGMSENRADMEKLLPTVKNIIPDAFIISGKR